jgi:hypothetical protein
MKLFSLIILLFFISLVHAGRVPTSTVSSEGLERLKLLYPQQSEAFILERIKNASTSFLRWRAFPPYFYQLLQRHPALLPRGFNERRGFCAGDAHFENFGFMYFGTTHFSINDLDDGVNCSLNQDMLRLHAGHRLMGVNFTTEEWLAEYKAGLAGVQRALPARLKELEIESLKKKTEMKKSHQKILLDRSCTGELAPLSANEKKIISEFLESEGKKLSFGCSLTKKTGGSAGNTRYLIYYPLAQGVELIELKPLVTPAPLTTTALHSRERAKIYQQAVTIFFGMNYNVIYYPVMMGGVLYQRRPVWGGNTEVKESGLTSQELKEILLYQARTLGFIHRSSNKSQSVDLDPKSWEALVTEVLRLWNIEIGG